MNHQECLDAIKQELLGAWYSAEDNGESDLLDALEEASETEEKSVLARRIFEGAIAYVAEELLTGGSKPELKRLVENYEREVQ